MRILQGEGGRGAVLPRLGAKVIVEAGAGGHGLGVEIGGEGAVLHKHNFIQKHPVHTNTMHPPIQQGVHDKKRPTTQPIHMGGREVSLVLACPPAYSAPASHPWPCTTT